jgi:hypothetical protein
MKTLTREQILGASDLVTERVPVPEWKGPVNLRSLTSGERDAFQASCWQGTGKDRRPNLDNVNARLLALVLVDDADVRLFSEADIVELAKKNGVVVTRLADKASEMNGLGEAQPARIEALAGNSEPGPHAG